jgi:carbon-monoxide dehydrogenase large subunit
MVDYDVLPAITDLAAAHLPGAPEVWASAPGNICFDWEAGDREKTDAAFVRAAHVTRLTVVNNRVVVASIEARAAVAAWEGGKLTLHTNTQGSWLVKNLLAKQVFNIPAEDVRVITPDVGGGFGMKLYLYAEHVLVAFAARQVGRRREWARADGGFQSDTTAATTSRSASSRGRGWRFCDGTRN